MQLQQLLLRPLLLTDHGHGGDHVTVEDDVVRHPLQLPQSNELRKA